MWRTVILASGASFLASIVGTALVLTIVLPAPARGQEASLHIEGVAVVGPDGTDRARLTAGPGATAGLTLLSPDGQTTRATMMTGGRVGDNAEGVGVNLFASAGDQLVRLGTVVGPDRVGSNLILFDAAGRPRIHLLVDLDGTPSIALLDEEGNSTWTAR
jgi:hypothetical protein